MILTTIDRLGTYAGAIPHWDRLEAFLASTDLRSLPVGRVEIDGDRLFAIVAEDVARPDQPDLEAHRRYVDVQIAIEGSFDVLWRPLSECMTVRTPYDADADIVFMSDTPSDRITMRPGLAAVLHPDDAHAPLPPVDRVKKIVFKCLF